MSKSRKSTKRPAVKKSTAKKSSHQPTKSFLIRAMPGVPAKEVVAALAKRGVKVTESYVYNVRGAAKKNVVSKVPHTHAHPHSGFPVRPEGELTAGEKLVAGFKAMALELGLSRAAILVLSMREANMAVLRESGAL